MRRQRRRPRGCWTSSCSLGTGGKRRSDVEAERNTGREETNEADRASTAWSRARWAIAVVLAAKVAFFALPLSTYLDLDAANAQQEAVPPAAPAVPPPTRAADSARSNPVASGEVAALLDAVGRRQSELDTREQALAGREQ